MTSLDLQPERLCIFLIVPTILRVVRFFDSLIIILLFSLPTRVALASAADDFDAFIQEYEEEKLKPKPEPTIAEMLDQLHTDIGYEIVESANSIDSFFVNERVIDGRNQTNFRIINTASMVEHHGFGNKAAFRLRLRLPKLQEKVQFELGQDDDTNRNTNITWNTSTFRDQERSTRAGFSFFKDILTLQSKLTGGARYRSGIVPFANFRLSRDIPITQKAKISFFNDTFADTKDKTGNRSTLYFDYALKKNLLFRWLNEGTYRDLDDSFQTLNGLALYQQLSQRRSISYLAAVTGLSPKFNSSFYANDYRASITYRQLIYKNYIYFEYAPGVSFPKDIDFKSQMEFLFRIEIIFGKI